MSNIVLQPCQTQIIDYEHEIVITSLKLAQLVSYGLTLFTLTAFDRFKFDLNLKKFGLKPSRATDELHIYSCH